MQSIIFFSPCLYVAQEIRFHLNHMLGDGKCTHCCCGAATLKHSLISQSQKLKKRPYLVNLLSPRNVSLI